VSLDYEVTERFDSTVRIALSGSLADEDWTRTVRRFLDPYYEDDNVEFIQIDLDQLERIDLEGVATLLRLSADAIERGKTVGVTGAHGGVWSKLQQTSALSHLKAG
jgi:ABC-type transporter Mla MlaB component